MFRSGCIRDSAAASSQGLHIVYSMYFKTYLEAMQVLCNIISTLQGNEFILTE